MTGSPSFSSLNLRARREALYVQILEEALLRLKKVSTGTDEFSLNRELYQCIIEVIRRRQSLGLPSLDIPPVYDGPNAPIDEHPTPHERKRPDFRWELIDHRSASLQGAVIPFVIECKRLGSRVGSRVLTELYVSTGVRRFVHPDWGYGRNSAAGVMVGYVESLNFSVLLQAVNGHFIPYQYPSLRNVALLAPGLQQSEHLLDRAFALAPYKLLHMWIDLTSLTSSSVLPHGPRS